jgi:hypothetical protein
MFVVWCSRFQFFHSSRLGPGELDHDGEAWRTTCDYFIYDGSN